MTGHPQLPTSQGRQPPRRPQDVSAVMRQASHLKCDEPNGRHPYHGALKKTHEDEEDLHQGSGHHGQGLGTTSREQRFCKTSVVYGMHALQASIELQAHPMIAAHGAHGRCSTSAVSRTTVSAHTRSTPRGLQTQHRRRRDGRRPEEHVPTGVCRHLQFQRS